MYIPQTFISKSLANDLALAIKVAVGGCPTENRVLILTKNKPDAKVGSIIIPDNTEEKPNKGVVIMSGEITDEYKTYKELIATGNIVTFGRYAGKEVDFDPNIFERNDISYNSDWKFSILSMNEILFVESKS